MAAQGLASHGHAGRWACGPPVLSARAPAAPLSTPLTRPRMVSCCVVPALRGTAGELVALYHYREAERIEGPAVVGETALLQVRRAVRLGGRWGGC